MTPSSARARRLAVALLVGGALAWSSVAQATPEFPGVVVQTLGLTKLEIDAPQGCTLCHTSDSGGTSLRTFGQLVQQYGAQPYQDSTLEGALAAVEVKEPALIDDIKAGRDPNDDPTTSSIPTPGYGCSTTGAVARSPWWPGLALAAFAWARSARGGRRRRRR
jgi:hypothetical protein